jgi:hypothetical protein
VSVYYAGFVAQGAPTSGTYSTGAFTTDDLGNVWVCTSGGTPGTWSNQGPGNVAALIAALAFENVGGGAFPTGLVTLTDAPTIAVNAAAGSLFRATINGNRTLGTPSSPVDGQPVTFEIIQGTGGGFTLGFSAAYAFPASIPQPSLSTTAGQRDFLQFRYDAGESLWQCTGWVPDQNAGVVALPQGGTGQTTQQNALNALAGAQTSGEFLRGNGTNVQMAAIQSSDLPALTAAPTWTDAAGLALNAEGAQASPTSPVSVTSQSITSVAGMTVPAGDPVAGAIYRITSWGFFTQTGSTSAITIGLTWGGTGGTSLVGSITITATASLTAFWTAEVLVTFTSPSACNAVLKWTHITSGTPAFTGSPHVSGSTSPVTVTVSSSQLLSINVTLANTTDTTAFECLGVVAERVY